MKLKLQLSELIIAIAECGADCQVNLSKNDVDFNFS